MTYTDDGTICDWQWCPLAMANGVEWSVRRRGQKDRFNCLYRRGLLNKALWFFGALVGVFLTPEWTGKLSVAENSV